MNVHLAIVMALCPAAAMGQYVFFDDFDGNDLLPHWNLFPPPLWQYNVINGMLTVTELNFPSHPHHPTNYAFLGASHAPQGDFQLDARFGWGASETVARFELTVMVSYGLVASIGYRQWPGTPGILAATDGGSVLIAAPSPGMYDFRIARTGSDFAFYFDDTLFAVLPSAYAGPIDGLSFYMSSPYPGSSGPFHIERIQVVPAPGVLPLALAFTTIRRRTTLLAPQTNT